MSALAAIIAFLKSIPALAKFGEWLGETIKAYDQKRNAVEAARRQAAKDADVDRRLAEFDRLHPYPSSAKQQPKTDGPSRLSSGSNSGSGVVQGSAENR